LQDRTSDRRFWLASTKAVTYEHSRMSGSSLCYLFQRRALFLAGLSLCLAAVAASARTARAGATFEGVPVQLGKATTALVPLSTEEKTYASVGGNRVPEKAVAVLTVPANFDPQKTWPVLLVFSTSDFHWDNRHDIPFYSTEALNEGWIVLTGDGPERPRDDSTGWRSAMTLAALDALHRSFPGSNRWPVACAGISGGAKRACLVAPLLAVKGNRVAGLYLAGVNQDLLGEGYRTFHPGADFLGTRIFITSGQTDRIATPAQTEAVRASMQKNGFRQVRLEMFPEGHRVKRPLTREALNWFNSGTPSVSVPENHSSSPAPTTSGDSSIRMEAHETGSGSQRKIAVTIKDPAQTAGAIDVHVYFVGKAPNGSRFIYAHADLSVNLRGATQASAKVDLTELKSDPNRRAPKGFVLAGIGTMEGWIAIARAHGRTVATQASTPALIELVQGKSKDSLPAMVSDYEKRPVAP
jgi:hypothetical protein